MRTRAHTRVRGKRIVGKRECRPAEHAHEGRLRVAPGLGQNLKTEQGRRPLVGECDFVTARLWPTICDGGVPWRHCTAKEHKTAQRASAPDATERPCTLLAYRGRCCTSLHKQEKWPGAHLLLLCSVYTAPST